MGNDELLERLDFIEFRQQLLFDDKIFNKVLFEHEVTRKQHIAILDLFDSLRNKINNGEEVNNVSYESDIYRLVPLQRYNYHFAEKVAKSLHEEGRYEEVFEALYGNAPKFQVYLEKQNS